MRFADSLSTRFALVGLTLLVAGCGGGNSKTSTTGVVTMNGQPVTTGYVQFADSEGRTAVGRLDSEGRFEVRSSRDVPGMDPGTYNVAVVAWEVEPSLEKEGVPLVSPTFMDATKSPLTAEVTEDGDNEFEFKVAPAEATDVQI